MSALHLWLKKSLLFSPVCKKKKGLKKAGLMKICLHSPVLVLVYQRQFRFDTAFDRTRAALIYRVKNLVNSFTVNDRSIMLVFLLLMVGEGKHNQAVITPLKPTEYSLRVHHN